MMPIQKYNIVLIYNKISSVVIPSYSFRFVAQMISSVILFSLRLIIRIIVLFVTLHFMGAWPSSTESSDSDVVRSSGHPLSVYLYWTRKIEIFPIGIDVSKTVGLGTNSRTVSVTAQSIKLSRYRSSEISPRWCIGVMRITDAVFVSFGWLHFSKPRKTERPTPRRNTCS